MDSEEIRSQIHELVKRYFSQQTDSFVAGTTNIPLASPPFDSDEVNEAIDSLLDTWVTMGEKVRKFEEMFAAYIGTKHAVMINSGSSANLLSLCIITNPLFIFKL